MRYLTAGESHGPQLTTIIEGFQQECRLSAEDINNELARRQKGHGRGRRMQIEKDTVILHLESDMAIRLASPVALVVENNDWKHWTKIMGSEAHFDEEAEEVKRKITRPRPGHADLNGGIKYGHRDLTQCIRTFVSKRNDSQSGCGSSCQKTPFIARD